jgi:hypothetical protein
MGSMEKEIRSVLAKLLTVFRVPELRRKIVLTVVLACRLSLGFHITLPFIDHDAIKNVMEKRSKMRLLVRGGLGGLLQVVSVFSASDPAEMVRCLVSESCRTSRPRSCFSCWAQSIRLWSSFKKKANLGAGV